MKKTIQQVTMYAPMQGVLDTLAREIYRQLARQTGMRLNILYENTVLRINLDLEAPTATIDVVPVIRGNMREQRVRDFVDMLQRGRERSEVPREPEPDIAAEPGG